MTLYQLSYLLLWVLAIVLVPISVVLVFLLARLESLFKREGLGHGNNLIGRKLPAFKAVSASTGAVRQVEEIVEGSSCVILAVSATCGSCASLIKELSVASVRDILATKIIVLCVGELESCRSAVADLRSVSAYVLTEQDDSTIDIWMAGFPAALIVDEQGFVIDVRHPLSISGLLAAKQSAKINRRYSQSAGASAGILDVEAG